MNLKPINIVGGGLAGLTLGIGLRRKGVPVTICEAGEYPRHRVCGEFISGRGQGALERLGMRKCLLDSGAIMAREAIFFLGTTATPRRSIAPAALCLSRFKMDALLAKHFVDYGGELQVKKNRRESHFEEGVVRATGRGVQAIDSGWRWFGLKVHARAVHLEADLEMHCQPNQYIGINRIEEGKVNVCGLFRRPVSPHEPAPSWQTLLRGLPGSPQYERLRDSVFDEASFCSVAGLPLRPQRACGRDECRIGDALTMIPPVTGNGMSMAFEAAELAIEPLLSYAQAQMSWTEAQQAIAQRCDKTFSRRLRWASGLQALLFRPWMQSKWGKPVLASGLLWRVLFTRTR